MIGEPVLKSMGPIVSIMLVSLDWTSAQLLEELDRTSAQLLEELDRTSAQLLEILDRTSAQLIALDSSSSHNNSLAP